MAYLNNTKFKEIREAAKGGNEKASMILQAMIKGGNQEDVDRLVANYYDVGVEPEAVAESQEIMANELEAMPENPTPVEETPVQADAGTVPMIEDLTEILDKELDGISNKEEIKEMSFKDFLGNKRTDGLKARKTADYFKAYNPESRNAYLSKKKEEYSNSFGGALKDIDRQYRDLDNSLGKYTQGVGDLLDDDKELDMDVAGKVYDNMTDSHDFMLGLNRGYDDEDYAEMSQQLQQIVAEYGKKNVMAALNTLRSDNSAYRDYKNGQINQEIERYGKNLDKLLK